MQEYTIELIQTVMLLLLPSLSEEKTQAVKKEFSKLQNNGPITTSGSEWASPLYVVKKPNGNFRCCSDYCLNSIIKNDKYPIPNINSIADKLASKTRFSKSTWYQHTIKSKCIRRILKKNSTYFSSRIA